jgi:hypothetical protein
VQWDSGWSAENGDHCHVESRGRVVTGSIDAYFDGSSASSVICTLNADFPAPVEPIVGCGVREASGTDGSLSAIRFRIGMDKQIQIIAGFVPNSADYIYAFNFSYAGV